MKFQSLFCSESIRYSAALILSHSDASERGVQFMKMAPNDEGQQQVDSAAGRLSAGPNG